MKFLILFIISLFINISAKQIIPIKNPMKKIKAVIKHKIDKIREKESFEHKKNTYEKYHTNHKNN